MARMIQCRRCEQEVEGFDQSPLPGKWEQELHDHACPGCFQDWMATETMIINEYRLDLSVPENQEQLNLEMAKFLRLPSAPEGEAAGPPPEATPQG